MENFKKHNFPWSMQLITAFSIMLHLEIGDARRISVFEVAPEKPQNITKLITRAAKKYKLDRRLLSCLYRVESNYQLTAESTTDDHGIGQVNGRTARALHINVNKLKSDLRYSINRSAELLAYWQWLYKRSEPRTWVCRYNVGNRELKGAIGAACERYLAKVYACTTSAYEVL